MPLCRLLDIDGGTIGVGEQERVTPPFPAAARQLIAYWTGLPIGRSLPRRSAVDPSAMVRILPNLFLVRREPVDGRAKLRFGLHGTAVVDILGMDLSRKFLDDLLAPAAAVRVAAAIDLAIDARTVVRQRLWSVFPGRGHILVDRTVCPLEADDARCTMAIGALIRCPATDTAPLRIETAVPE